MRIVTMRQEVDTDHLNLYKSDRCTHEQTDVLMYKFLSLCIKLHKIRLEHLVDTTNNTCEDVGNLEVSRQLSIEMKIAINVLYRRRK